MRRVVREQRRPPGLRLLCMDAERTDWFSTLQKARWVEFASRLAVHPDPVRMADGAVQPR
jgi:hypothetical protein